MTKQSSSLPDTTRTTHAVKVGILDIDLPKDNEFLIFNQSKSNLYEYYLQICCNNIYHRGMQIYRFYNNTVL